MGEKSKASGLRRGRKGAWLAMREKVLHCIRCTDGKDRRKKSGHFRQACFSFLLLLIIIIFFLWPIRNSAPQSTTSYHPVVPNRSACPIIPATYYVRIGRQPGFKGKKPRFLSFGATKGRFCIHIDQTRCALLSDTKNTNFIVQSSRAGAQYTTSKHSPNI